jgi:hypothetical protein
LIFKLVQIRLGNEFFALYQGTTLVVPKGATKSGALAPALFPLEIRADFTMAGAEARTFWPGGGTTKVVP